MALTVDDLKPKNFKVKIKGVDLESKPLRLADALSIAKIGNVLQEHQSSTQEEIQQAQSDLDAIIGRLIPDLKDVELDFGATVEVIQELMEHVEPEDNKELKKRKVNLDTDPKA